MLVRSATGEADLILGCDLLTAGAVDAISKISLGRTLALVNTHEQPPGQFARNPDWQFPAAQVRSLINDAAGPRAELLCIGCKNYPASWRVSLAPLLAPMQMYEALLTTGLITAEGMVKNYLLKNFWAIVL